jgi:hypothetical protein
VKLLGQRLPAAGISSKCLPLPERHEPLGAMQRRRRDVDTD